MQSIVKEIPMACAPEAVMESVHHLPGVVLLRSASFDTVPARYSMVAPLPFLRMRAQGARCDLAAGDRAWVQFGNPWRILEGLMSRYEILDEVDVPFPLGGCFGCWGYDLKDALEHRLPRRAVNDLELPDAVLGFHDGLLVWDHLLNRVWVVSTGLRWDGSRDEAWARERARALEELVMRAAAGGPGESGEEAPEAEPAPGEPPNRARTDSSPGTARPTISGVEGTAEGALRRDHADGASIPGHPVVSAGTERGAGWGEPDLAIRSNVSREQFIAMVERAQRYIRAGDVYQVNLSQRLAAPWPGGGWRLFRNLMEVSPAPLAAFLSDERFEMASSSPELFLRLSGGHMRTRPIKGTRPRSPDPTRDAQLTYELQTSAKEMAELVMITDLLRNDLGRVCEFGTVQVPELVRLERYPQVQHLVSTVEGRLRADVSHVEALAHCFPGGSITGAPKIRAMEIIDELEPVTRGPYTGCAGYLGFNRESQLSIVIRTALRVGGTSYWQAGAGIVADSQPEAEYEETLAKATGWRAALLTAARLRQRGACRTGELVI